MTPTPRTDAAEIMWNDIGMMVVLSSFARQLERELAAESDQLAANHEATKLMGKWLEAERELADRLARELEGCAELTSAHESLAAWKEARSE